MVWSLPYLSSIALAHWCLQVTRRNLEQLRTIKTRMVRLFTKVETIRELLERLLDDDDDMRDMNLTAKCAIHMRSFARPCGQPEAIAR